MFEDTGNLCNSKEHHAIKNPPNKQRFIGGYKILFQVIIPVCSHLFKTVF
jgi:hypothetical protein